VRKCNSRKIF